MITFRQYFVFLLICASSFTVAQPAAPVAEPSAVVTSESPLVKFLSDNSINISEIEVFGERAYPAENKEFPWRLKCTEFDYRSVHGCLETRFFDPSARVYFDTGNDDLDEIDLFNDGGLNATIDFVSLYLPWRFGRSSYYDQWTLGPMLGVGISSPAQDSADGTAQASGAPVVLVSYGGMIEYKIGEGGASFGFEIGRATGFSSDESLGDTTDSATYVGLKINIPTSSRSD
ncbi:MAG: hypothetical protein HOM20_08035 [Porticoccaceae bacterium]|jgi:hypothetical protein|nr:hypothetical protein [Porticoccaceae bacterium]